MCLPEEAMVAQREDKLKSQEKGRKLVQKTQYKSSRGPRGRKWTGQSAGIAKLSVRNYCSSQVVFKSEANRR